VPSWNLDYNVFLFFLSKRRQCKLIFFYSVDAYNINYLVSNGFQRIFFFSFLLIFSVAMD